MAERLTVPPELDAAQRRSSNPEASVWVSANAGAGKTYVLAQRVVRLLLAGVAPRSILCLTYTNAAAAEMASRVFSELARLATLPADALAERIAVLAPGADPAAAAARARTLFAEALETPGGLKVQTLHAFASALLRRFPLEANISGAFQVLDDATREEMTDRAIATVLGKATKEPDGRIAAAVEALLPHVSDQGLGGAIRTALSERRRLRAWLLDGAGTAKLTADLEAALGLDDLPDEPPFFDDEDCRRLIDRIRAAKQSAGVADSLTEMLETQDPDDRAAKWASIFLTGKGEARKTVVAKAILADEDGLDERIRSEQARLMACAERDRARKAVAATVPLVQLAWEVLGVIERDKRRRGLIDYDDQIERAMNLVRSGSAAAWVRFKLDEGIDHVLVDEAQDTSPPQWQMVDALTEEFFAGHGARPVQRTLFVVGDEKQSIYSFQGAAPHLFAEKRRAYHRIATDAGLAFEAVDLAHSMRSAPEVLSAVDRVFGVDALAAAVGAEAGAVRHLPVRPGPGGVDVWPLFADSVSEKPDAWELPFDHTADDSGMMKLVRAIADQIEAWCVKGPGGGPPIEPGDVMILARKREPFATLMNRELKRRRIPAAGSDRLDVTAHIAVKDMLALGRALISTDDLSLAAVLKSPLFGFDEDALFAVAHGRERSLLAALANGDQAAREAHARLLAWGRAARTERPFDLFARILIGEGRRADFAARMGSEAEDVLDAFLDLALDYEGRGIPTLETFLINVGKSKQQLSRTADGRANVVRVMTAHGSKGLEAPVVFLADNGNATTGGGFGAPMIPLPQPNAMSSAQLSLALGAEDEAEGRDVLVYAPTKEHHPQKIAELHAARTEAERQEHYRLLYVGMTRAERQLVVCGSYKTRAPSEDMWHRIVSDALASEAEAIDTPEGQMLRWRRPGGAPLPAASAEPAPPAAEPASPPDWLSMPAGHVPGAPEPIAPSAGEHVIAAGPADVERRPLGAADFGSVLHALLEREEADEAMGAFVAASYPALAGDAVAGIVAEARAVLDLDVLREGVVKREIDVTGDVRLADGTVRRATGRIDRLQLSPGRVLIIDYKTDRVVPATPESAPDAYRTQLGIYRALVAAMMPGYEVSTAIIWTARPLFMPMDGALVAAEVVRGGLAA
ncbi:double-strand break repair helicase AddA [Acuticoccus sp. M5D2P5]|uniref:double-strand break repair helicase AddA n=1 Tax=Acuticoccus kalidii TaxID=2910977 RepID=UPI001F2226E3|nr:double-strand break repair helicase AddA [Acuticoccus kalidii]MCF3933910.1 double-strand break repair helicase AddA [Acuticoccus kalidii]